MTANAGYHAYATGDVLTAAQVQYNLQNQTVMYFASSAARTTALSGVLVEGMVSYIPANGLEYYNGSAWVLVAADQTPLTTKGDLFTYSTTDTRLPIGTNGQTLVANSGATTGNAWQDPVQQNPVLNSAFQVWQRGTSFSLAASTSTPTYLADRWCATTNANQACTISRQATGDTTNLPNIQYAMRFQRNSGQTGTGQITVVNNFETINTIPFVGKTITVSFYARAGANYSMASNNLYLISYTGTGTDQNALSGYTGSTLNYSTVTLTTSWQRFSYTYAVTTSTTEMGVGTSWIPSGTAGANDYYDVTGFQVEVGSVATPFHTFSTTLQGELAACQRYYFRDVVVQTNTAGFAVGYMDSATNFRFVLPMPVTMRGTPSLAFSAAADLRAAAATGSYIASAYTLYGVTSNGVYAGITISGATAGQGGTLNASTTTAAYIELSAEL